MSLLQGESRDSEAFTQNNNHGESLQSHNTLKCICFFHNTVIDTDGLDKASVLGLEKFQVSFSPNLDKYEGQVRRSDNTSNFKARRVTDAFPVYFDSDVSRTPENNS